MPTRNLALLDFGVGQTIDIQPGSRTVNYELNPGDYSWYDALRVVLALTGVGAAEAGDTLDVYLQCRDSANASVWEDRIHFEQLLGTAAVTVLAPEERVANLQAFGTLADGEEYSEPSGSAGATRLAAGTVKNGPFPGRYLVKGQPDTTRGQIDRGAAWRLQFVVVDANSNGAFRGRIQITGNAVQ